MNLISDLFYCIKISLTKTVGSIGRDYKVIAIGPMLAAVLAMFSVALTPLRLVGNIILLLVSCLLFSAFIYYVECSVRGRRLSVHDINFAMRTYAVRVMGVMVILYLLNTLVAVGIGMTFFAGVSHIIMPILYIAEFVVAGAVPETIYRKSCSDFETILSSARFTMANPFQWLVTNGLVILGVYKLIEYSYAYGMSAVVFTSFLASLVLGPFMVFRGFLYEMLDSGTIKKRVFMRNNNMKSK